MDRFETTGTSARGLVAAMVAAPLLMLAAEAVSPRLAADAGRQVGIIAAHPDRWYWYTLLLVAGTVAFVPAVVGVMQLLRTRSRRLAAVGGALACFGGIVGVADGMTQFFVWQLVRGGADHAQVAAMVDRYDNSAAANVFFTVGGPALLAGMITLTVAMLRTRVVPAWAAVAFAAGGVVNIVGFSANSVAILAVSCLLLLAGLWPAARALSRAGRLDRSPATAARPARPASPEDTRAAIV